MCMCLIMVMRDQSMSKLQFSTIPTQAVYIFLHVYIILGHCAWMCCICQVRSSSI